MRSGEERRGEARRGEERRSRKAKRGEGRRERRGEARRGEVRGMKMKGLLTLPNYEVTVSVAVPEGVLDSIWSTRATDLVCRAIKKSKNVIKIGGDLTHNWEIRGDSELLTDLFVVKVEAIGIPVKIPDDLSCMAAMDEIEGCVENFSKLRIVPSPHRFVVLQNARISVRCYYIA